MPGGGQADYYVFQFLHGAIKSAMLFVLITGFYKFQFLHGAIKSRQSFFFILHVLPFQFLHGAIKSKKGEAIRIMYC